MNILSLTVPDLGFWQPNEKGFNRLLGSLSKW